jgi:glycosyltransferase involved in cell wall biosynthesis
MKILSIEFTPHWSWGLICNAIYLRSKFDFKRVFINSNPSLAKANGDVILFQNVTLLKKFKEREFAIGRMGGNQNFESGGNIAPLLKEMGKCFCLIATNKKLYNIAKSVNSNVYLIPNGLDLNEWSILYRNSADKRNLTVGFCGNISNDIYREYKGYDFVKEACEKIGVNLKTALYADNQIPHDKMRELFYSQIDCLVHPTRGEGCSNTIMEACACGIPVITTREAGLHGELMEHGKNVLFCERNTQSIIGLLKELRGNINLRRILSSGARKFAENYHDIIPIAEQYEIIFRECYNKNNGGNKMILKVLSMVFNKDGAKVVYRINNGTTQFKTYPPGYDEQWVRQQLQLECCKITDAKNNPEPPQGKNIETDIPTGLKPDESGGKEAAPEVPADVIKTIPINTANIKKPVKITTKKRGKAKAK